MVTMEIFTLAQEIRKAKDSEGKSSNDVTTPVGGSNALNCV